MISIITKIVSTAAAIAAIIGIKILDLPGLITALLVIIVFVSMIFVMAGVFDKKKSTETQAEISTKTKAGETSNS